MEETFITFFFKKFDKVIQRDRKIKLFKFTNEILQNLKINLLHT